MTHEAHAAAVEAAKKTADAGFMQHTLAHSDALVSAYLAALAERGFKVVPREATSEMVGRANDFGCYSAFDGWKAMHDAAPPWPPTEKG